MATTDPHSSSDLDIGVLVHSPAGTPYAPPGLQVSTGRVSCAAQQRHSRSWAPMWILWQSLRSLIALTSYA